MMRAGGVGVGPAHSQRRACRRVSISAVPGLPVSGPRPSVSKSLLAVTSCASCVYYAPQASPARTLGRSEAAAAVEVEALGELNSALSRSPRSFDRMDFRAVD